MLSMQSERGNQSIKKKVLIGLLLCAVVLSALLLFQKPIQWSLMTFHTFTLQKEFYDSGCFLVGDSNISESIINKDNVRYCYDNYTVQISIPQHSGIIVLENESDYIVEDCYLLNEFYYFFLTKPKDAHGPSTVKNHKSDKLVKVNCNTGVVSDVYQTSPEEFILFSDEQSVILFHSDSGQITRVELDTEAQYPLLTINKKSLTRIVFSIGTTMLKTQAKYKDGTSESAQLNYYN